MDLILGTNVIGKDTTDGINTEKKNLKLKLYA